MGRAQWNFLSHVKNVLHRERKKLQKDSDTIYYVYTLDFICIFSHHNREGGGGGN